MIPDSVAEELAVIYGEQPAQTPEPEAAAEPATPEAAAEPATPEPEPEPATPEAAAEPATPAMPLLGGLHYRVEPGDTPASIATALYGDACHAAALVEHNQRAGLLINDNLTVNGVILLP